ncbi:MAG: hypothetical protein U0228_32325 [Myxococcaceae bacterium]
MRQAMGVVLALAVSGCCCEPKKVSYAEVPLTLSAAKKQAKELGAEISVERKTRSAGGGGGCGHSAACVILLPIILYEIAFPETWDEVVIRKDGEVLLFATFDKGGDLLHAQHLKDGEVIETTSITLKSLDQRAYVDVAKQKPLPDGGAERIPLPLSAKHDFVADERKLLEKTTDPQKRAQAIVDSASLLETEGLAFATELLNKGESDQTRSEVVRFGCRQKDTWDKLGPLIEKDAGAWVRLRQIDCTDAETPARFAAVGRFFGKACEATSPLEPLKEFESGRGLDDLVDRYGDGRKKQVLDAMGPCPAGPRRALVQLWLGEPVDTAELESLRGTDAMALGSLHLRADQPNQLAMMVQLITTGDAHGGILLRRLEADKVEVTDPALLEALAKSYVKHSGVLERGDRPATLHLFERAGRRADADTITVKARAVIAAAAKATKDPADRAMYEAVLVLLGDESRLEAASTNLFDPKYAFDSPTLAENVPTYVLRRMGCTQVELDSAAASKKGLTRCSGPRPE